MLDTIASLLKQKKTSKLVSVAPSACVTDAVRAMNDNNVGSVLVMDQQSLLGIFTERDVIVRVVGATRDPAATLISQVMTTPVRSVSRDPPRTMLCD